MLFFICLFFICLLLLLSLFEGFFVFVFVFFLGGGEGLSKVS